MFGLSAGSDYSRQAEEILKLEDPIPDQARLRHLVDQIFQDLKDILPGDSVPDLRQTARADIPAPAQPEQEPAPNHGQAQLLIVSTDAEWVSGLQRFALPTLALLSGRDPGAGPGSRCLTTALRSCLIDLASLGLEDEFLNTLVPLLQACAQLPVMVTTSTDSFEVRRQIARHCSCSFLPRDASFLCHSGGHTGDPEGALPCHDSSAGGG